MGDNIIDNPTKEYKVFPTIAPNKDGKYEDQTQDQAEARGEVFNFKNKRRAKKFAYGSWKEGEAKKDAMRDYRANKKKTKLRIRSKK